MQAERRLPKQAANLDARSHGPILTDGTDNSRY
jgi:hypothetical protein